jgi:DnaA family protein
MKQIPLAIGADAPRTFDSFVPGANVAALAHLHTLAHDAGPPVYLWGPPGSGKTHLLCALAHARQQHGARVGWFDAAHAQPWTFDAAWSLVVLDDCHALDAARQQAAFALFVEAGTHAVQWAAAGALPPVDLPVRDDLRTRLGWGHVYALEPLAEDLARATLRREADRRGIFLSDDVMDYLLRRFARDLKHLMALLDRLDDFALAQQRAVTVPLVRRMLEEEGRP